jgi:transcriptional regulator GlxA family with amidase domain
VADLTNIGQYPPIGHLSDSRMNITILALEGCMPSAVIGIADMIAIANTAIRRRGGDVRLKCRTVSLDGRDVSTVRGQKLAVDGGIGDAAVHDAIIVTGFLVNLETFADRIKKFSKAAAWLRRRHANGSIVSGFCTGVFILAEAGLLNGRRATTTWWLQSELKQCYPRVDLALDAVVTETDNVVCAAGPMSWIDLVLRLIEMAAGAETARICADFAVLDTGHRTQAVYMPQGYLLKRDPWLVEAEMIVRRFNPRQITVRKLAAALGSSERTLHRRIKALAGESPQSFIGRIRIEMARTLLETTARSVKDIANSSGYRDESSFRKAFRKRVSMNPRDYRSKKARPQPTKSAKAAPKARQGMRANSRR